VDRFEISDVLTKVPLEDVFKRLGIETERHGSQIRALCPFHQDSRPSLNLYRADGTAPAHYHCFACGAHGTAIDLVKKVEGLEFLPAVKWLGEQFSLSSAKRPSPKEGKRKVESQTALDFALSTFDAKHDAKGFKAWCVERKFDDTFLYAQGLRCISRGVLMEALHREELGARAELVDGLENLGLVKRLRSQSSANEQFKLDLLDQFRDCFHDGRIVIPIRSTNAKRPRVVGFAGRALANEPPEGTAKYLLTSGFDKSNHLFNADHAFEAVDKTLKHDRPATLYLVEGFLDALRIQSLGLPAVALMGISLSDGQLELLKKMAESATGKGELTYSVFLDSDPAGFNGASRLVRRLLDLHGIDLRWVALPWRTEPALGKDPDTCLRDLATHAQADTWLRDFELPAEGILVASELGSQDASDLQALRWEQIAGAVRERAVFRAAMAVKRLYGPRLTNTPAIRLRDYPWPWAQELHEILTGPVVGRRPIERDLYLDEALPRAALARRLAYHGARRGELPCDEGAWQVLNSNEHLFDATALARIRATVRGDSWHQAAPFDAVHLPRKLSTDKVLLDDPRRKVMPHPADLHAQQMFLNELLTNRHDRLSASGQAFSAGIPAVRWYSSRQAIVVTGTYEALNEPNPDWDEPETLSFGYQIDMDVLEGDKTPSDQGMFRPFGQCWRDFMASLMRQCHAIGPRVHVLRLDAKRYYDSIQRYVVREELQKPLSAALRDHRPEGFTSMFGLPTDSSDVDGALERLLNGLVFGHEYHNPEFEANTRRSDGVTGIPQGPVLSAYIGTIAMFPVDDAARKFIRRTLTLNPDGSGKRRPRAGYARYVDDVVLFADDEALLKELRELLQAKASEHSISLIHKGELVRSGTPSQVMHQLNDGRGLAASVPAWEPPIVGDGESDWSLGDDLPKVDRQCALQMLQHPTLIERPESILDQVRAAMSASDLRVTDLGLCARWLWWHIALVDHPVDADSAWTFFWNHWNEVSSSHGWASEFKLRGYDKLFAVEGLDKLLDPNPWQLNGQFLTEREKRRADRIALARLVSEPGFFESVRPSHNSDHIKRRMWLVARKAWKLTGDGTAPSVIAPQGNRDLTSIEWLCLAGSLMLNTTPEANPLAALVERKPVRVNGLALTDAVVDQLMGQHAERTDCTEVGLAIDFVVRSARRHEQLSVLAKFPNLLSCIGGDQKRWLIPHLPILSQKAESIYEIDATPESSGRYLYRCTLSDDTSNESEMVSHFVHTTLCEPPPSAADVKPIHFKLSERNALTIRHGRSLVPQRWNELNFDHTSRTEPKTRFAARLFLALLAMHRWNGGDGNPNVYVPFRPQIFQENEGESLTLHLLADPVPNSLLGVSAWYHDRDERVQSANVPLAGAEMWRVGWAVADVLGVASDMAGETGVRDELLDDTEEFNNEAFAKLALESYVLRQQLRKLQGGYISSASVDTTKDTVNSLPGTVNRALELLLEFPADQGLDAQARHVILMEVESRAMAMRMNMRIGDDLRHSLHRAFPDVLARLPLWAIAGLKLHHTPHCSAPLRPEPALMLALYKALYPASTEYGADTYAPSQRTALALAAVAAGLRGSVAAFWGYAANLGSRRMSENLNLPAEWSIPDVSRLDPQGDYRAIRKALFDGDWPTLCKTSPWQWMLALIGLLDASFAQAFSIHPLREIFVALSIWQTTPARVEATGATDEPWPFDSLPRFTVQQCEGLVRALPEALCALDSSRGMYVIRVRGRAFGRSRDTSEFTDAMGAGWQMSRPQYTNLYANTVEEERPVEEGKVFKIWTETRSSATNDLLAIHTLDTKLGKWLPSWPNEIDIVETHVSGRRQATALNDAVANHAPSPTHELRSASAPQSEFIGHTAEQSTPRPNTANGPLLATQELDDENEENSAAFDLKRLNEWQSESWKNRLGGETTLDREARISSQFRVALFQFRVDDSYVHPLSEVGLSGLPLSNSSQNGLRSELRAGDVKDANRAAQRHHEFSWQNDAKVISWPEHRRRVLLSQALKACRDMRVELLVLPEVSVRPDTLEWLKTQLPNNPGLAVLAGTYRHFEATDVDHHLKEQLTLLWKPDSALEEPLGLEGDTSVIELKRGKKYRAVAAHELFRPDTGTLDPLYTEEKLLKELRRIRGRAKKEEWSASQLIPLVQALVHGPQKLRYCMELICSELFMLTSPANRPPLEQELGRIMQLFGGNPSEATQIVSNDVRALGELMTVAQRRRERRSVLLVPAFTSRSNDYWHAGQASVLASGTATVFCNAANKKISVGGSCFIGIDSVSGVKPEHAGIVRLLTPYHGWSRGILQADGKGALSPNDQALVVADIDPVHVVSGKPRPQLLPEPMSLVAYLPVIEIVNKKANAAGLTSALSHELTSEGSAKLHDMLTNEAFPETCGQLHVEEDFTKAWGSLIGAKQNGTLNSETGGAKVETFKDFFGDPRAVRERILAWLRDRHQQPAPKAGELRLEPAWLDFLVADLTWRHSSGKHPEIRVPPWQNESAIDFDNR